MKRALRYERRILKDLKRLDSENQARILSALERFAATGDGDVRPLRGEFAGSYRIRGQMASLRAPRRKGDRGLSDRQPRRGVLIRGMPSAIGALVATSVLRVDTERNPSCVMLFAMVKAVRVAFIAAIVLGPYSLALDPVHKEIMMASAGGNGRVRPTRGVMSTVITFSWPEIF